MATWSVSAIPPRWIAVIYDASYMLASATNHIHGQCIYLSGRPHLLVLL